MRLLDPRYDGLAPEIVENAMRNTMINTMKRVKLNKVDNDNLKKLYDIACVILKIEPEVE